MTVFTTCCCPWRLTPRTSLPLSSRSHRRPSQNDLNSEDDKDDEDYIPGQPELTEGEISDLEVREPQQPEDASQQEVGFVISDGKLLFTEDGESNMSDYIPLMTVEPKEGALVSSRESLQSGEQSDGDENENENGLEGRGESKSDTDLVMEKGLSEGSLDSREENLAETGAKLGISKADGENSEENVPEKPESYETSVLEDSENVEVSQEKPMETIKDSKNFDEGEKTGLLENSKPVYNATEQLEQVVPTETPDESDENADPQEKAVAAEVHENVDEEIPKHNRPRRLSRSSLSSLETDSITSVYSAAGTIGRYGIVKVTGEISISINYDYKLGNIEVNIKECSNLAAVDRKRKRSDPHVKGYLLPDKSKEGKRKTKTKRHTLNPVFDEIMKFSVTISELETRTLWLTVWHTDRLGQNFFLGEVTIPLGSDTLMLTEPTWFPLQERLEPSEYLSEGKGELYLSIKYLPPDITSVSKRKKDDLSGADKEGSLHLLIKQARNLNSMHATYTSDPFCKCYLLPEKSRSGKQKTPVLKNTINPIWNHTFVYDRVTIDELKERCLELTLWDYDPITSNIFLGGIRLSLGLGTSRGEPVTWMDSEGEEARVWTEMVNKENQWVDGTIPLRPSMYVLVNRN